MSRTTRPLMAAPLIDKRKVSPKTTYHHTNHSNSTQSSVLDYIVNKGSVIVLCPETTSADALIACLLISDQSLDTNMIIMTDNADSINSRFAEDLDPSYYVPYDMSSLTTVTHPSIVFVDDINKFITRDWKDLLSEHHYIFIHRRSSTVEGLYKLFRGQKNNTTEGTLPVIRVNISDSGLSLKYTVHTSRQSLKQTNTNFFIESVSTDSNTSNDCDEGQGGWISKNMLGSLSELSPKLQGLFTYILMRPFDKHIIYCPRVEELGLELVSTFLIYLEIKHSKIYDKVANQSSDDVRCIVKTFNQSSGGVLLCNVCPPHRIENIETLHVLDFVDLSVLDQFIDRCYQREQYNVGSSGLEIVFHVSTRKVSESPTIDEEQFTNITSEIRRRRQEFKKLWSCATCIVNKNNTLQLDI